MINKIRSLPLRAAVAVQTSAFTMQSQTETSSLTSGFRSRRGRTEMAIGAVMAYIVAASQAPAMAKVDANKTRDSASGLLDLINTFTTFLIIVLAAGSLLMGVFAALQFVGSGGNTKVIENAKRTIKNVIIGLVVAAGIFIIKNAIITLVGAPNADKGTNGKDLRKELGDDGIK